MAGGIEGTGKVSMTKKGLDDVFAKMPPCLIALEVGTHSPWVSRHLAAMGHEVIVANPHRIKLITQSNRKNTGRPKTAGGDPVADNVDPKNGSWKP